MNGQSQMRPLVAAVKSLVDAFPHRNVSDDTLMQYVEDLEDLPESLVVEAIRRLRRTSTFLPAIAEIRGLVIDAVLPQVSFADAWDELGREMERCWRDQARQPTFDDPAIAEAVRQCGWQHLRMDDMKYTRPDFEKALKVAQERRRRDVQDGTVAIGGGEGRGGPLPLSERLAD